MYVQVNFQSKVTTVTWARVGATGTRLPTEDKALALFMCSIPDMNLARLKTYKEIRLGKITTS